MPQHFDAHSSMPYTDSLREGTFPSTCWECSVNCGSLVTVTNGVVTKVAPNPEQPYSRGNFCIKGIRGGPDLAAHPLRVLHPMRRAGARGSGKWRRVSWDEALDEMADRIAEVRRKHGPQSIVGATSGANFSRSLMTALMVRSIGSPNWMINQDLCGGCRAVSASVTGLDIDSGGDVEHTHCALIVGRNPAVADPIQWAALKAAKKRGARIVAIDPKRTPVADMADLWLAPRVGTDAALALAMINVLIEQELYDREFVNRWCIGFDELAERARITTPAEAEKITGVPAENIIAAAQMYADGPSTFLSGHGIDAFAGGHQAFRAYHCLVAISGNVDRPGGNLRSKKPKGFSNYIELLHRPEHRLPIEIEQRTIGAERYPLWAGPEGWQTACHNPSVIEAMLTGNPYPIRAAYISGVNILLTYPDTRRTLAALRSLEFVAVATHLMTPTAEMADIVLPKTTSVEEEEVSFQAAGQIVLLSQAAPPRGEARQEIDIAVPLLDRLEARQALTKRLLPWPSQRAFNEHLLAGSGISFAELQAKGWARPDYQIGNFNDRPFPTPSGKIELFSSRLVKHGLDPLPAFENVLVEPETSAESTTDALPLTLITGDREKTFHHTRFHEQPWAQKVSPDPRVLVNPVTARTVGIDDGDWVLVETATGSCRLRAKLTDATPPDVVSTGMGWWRPHDVGPDRGVLDININAALSYSGPYDPATGSASIRGQRCRISRVTDELAHQAAASREFGST